MARQNDHIRAEELMSAYLDKRVSAEEKDFFERHIASCVDCRAQLEATRSLVAAMKAMPLVKAPRSFVLPREMAKQPKRSFLTLYPALRLATVVAAIAFVVLFAGDLLILQSGGGAAQQFIPAAAPAPAAMQAPEAARQAAPTQEPAAEAANDATLLATEPAAPPAAGAAAKSAISETAAITESATAGLPTATPAPTATTEVAMSMQMTVEATPESAVVMLDQQATSATANLTEAPAAIDPLRVIEIALLVLAVALGIATLVVRRKQA